jgi:sugar/nucleoside kinase (ribokinase family)
MAQLHRTDKPVVLGLGATAIDYLATVEKFPQPDEKIRSRSFTIQGGGNVANTLTALARLGIASRLLTKLGDDAIGRDILADLEKEGIDTSFVVVKAQMTSPITYVIVDESTRTRTCIHTPAAEELTVADVSAHEALWSRVALVHLDSRHTLAALAVAREAVARGIPVVLDIEKNRPYAMELIALADYIITNATYPLQFSERASEEPRRLSVLNGLIAMLEYGRAQFVIGTQGAEGSLMVRRRSQSEEHQPLSRYEEETLPLDLPVLVRSDTFPPATSCSGCEPLYAVLRCPAWPVSKPIVDTTGAGDAYIAGIIYGLLHRMELARMMALASFVAAEKLTGPGARFALPKREHLPLALRAEATVSARDDLAQGLSKTG